MKTVAAEQCVMRDSVYKSTCHQESDHALTLDHRDHAKKSDQK